MIGLSTDDGSSICRRLPGLTCEPVPFLLLHAALSIAPWTEVVACPLVGDTFDAMDLAHELEIAEFAGRLIVMVPALPRPAIIARELANAGPSLDIELIARARH